MPYKDKEKEKQYHKDYSKKWREAHREQYRKRTREWQSKNRDKTRGYQQKYYWTHREQEIARCLKGNVKRYHKLRMEALIHYGGNPPRCACCGEIRIPFLTIDHIKGQGNVHRKEIKRRFGWIYAWLKAEKYPPNFRVLCMNCNTAIAWHGICPHQEEGTSALESEISLQK
ncbi:hypothetical protein ES703_119149 [subsurface metagenome]